MSLEQHTRKKVCHENVGGRCRLQKAKPKALRGDDQRGLELFFFSPILSSPLYLFDTCAVRLGRWAPRTRRAASRWRRPLCPSPPRRGASIACRFLRLRRRICGWWREAAPPRHPPILLRRLGPECLRLPRPRLAATSHPPLRRQRLQRTLRRPPPRRPLPPPRHPRRLRRSDPAKRTPCPCET